MHLSVRAKFSPWNWVIEKQLQNTQNRDDKYLMNPSLYSVDVLATVTCKWNRAIPLGCNTASIVIVHVFTIYLETTVFQVSVSLDYVKMNVKKFTAKQCSLCCPIEFQNVKYHAIFCWFVFCYVWLNMGALTYINRISSVEIFDFLRFQAFLTDNNHYWTTAVRTISRTWEMRTIR